MRLGRGASSRVQRDHSAQKKKANLKSTSAAVCAQAANSSKQQQAAASSSKQQQAAASSSKQQQAAVRHAAAHDDASRGAHLLLSPPQGNASICVSK